MGFGGWSRGTNSGWGRNWGNDSGGSSNRRSSNYRRPTNTGLSASFVPPQSEQRFTPAGYNSPLHNQYVAEHSGNGVPVTQSGYRSYVDQWNTFLNSGGPGTETTPSYSGGGGGGYGGGGGGGGGGAPAMTQALLDSMMSVLGARAPALALQQTDLPDFRGQPLGAFNASPYVQATNQLTGAVNADKAAAARAATTATKALQANYTNPYANAQVSTAPQAQQVGTALQATAGGGGNQAQVAQQTDAAAASDQASFANLLSVLGATDQAAQTSRLNQVELDRGTALQNIGAQSRGLLGGISMARSQAANQWQQAQQERAYQNSLMQQQWQREEMMRNQDVRNQQNQANWQQSNEYISTRLTPLLQLLGQTQGTKLNTDALTKLIQQWSAGAR